MKPRQLTLIDSEAAKPASEPTKVITPTSTKNQTPPADDGEFKWSDDESIIVPEQHAVAAYFNPAGGLVIRQERAWDQEEDTIIVIAQANVDRFLDRLTDICGIPTMRP